MSTSLFTRVPAPRAAGMPTLGVCRVPGTEASLAAADRVIDRVSAYAIFALLEDQEL